MAKKKHTPLVALIATPQGLEAAINRYVTASLHLKERQAAHEKQISELKADFGKESQPLGDEILSLETGIQLYEQLAVAGIRFTQGENFFIEPKSQVLDATRKPVESEVAA